MVLSSDHFMLRRNGYRRSPHIALLTLKNSVLQLLNCSGPWLLLLALGSGCYNKRAFSKVPSFSLLLPFERSSTLTIHLFKPIDFICNNAFFLKREEAVCLHKRNQNRKQQLLTKS